MYCSWIKLLFTEVIVKHTHTHTHTHTNTHTYTACGQDVVFNFNPVGTYMIGKDIIYSRDHAVCSITATCLNDVGSISVDHKFRVVYVNPTS